MEIKEFVRTQHPFDCLNESELEQVVQSLEPAHFPRGRQILARSGPSSRYLYLIRQGAVRLEFEGQVVQVLEEGELFGYPSVLSRQSPSFDVVAEEDTLTYQIPEHIFQQLLERPPFAEFFLKGLSERLQQASSLELSPLAGDMATPVEALITRPPVFVSAEASVAEAARAMRQAWISSVLVTGDPPGIITDRDLRSRVLAEGLGPETLVRQVMSRPLKTLPVDTPVYGALLFMLQEHIHHLPLTRHGEIAGVITDTDLLRHRTKSPLYLLKRVRRLAGEDNLARHALDIAGMVEALFEGGLDVAQIGRIVASLNDALIKRLLTLAEEELGPPPTPYAWIVFGSEGRQEQTLLTDQDNALIYAEDSPIAQIYFERLAQRVVTGLTQAGFPLCPGGYMATHWRRPLQEWEQLFRTWVHTPEPQALLEAAIFFDFRRVHGLLSLNSLEEIFLKAGERGLFLAHLARAALGFQPPLGFFHRIRAEEGGVDLKKGGIAPIVGLARLYALEVGDPSRSTLARLEAAGQAGTLSQNGAEILAEAFRFILHLRLREQLRAYRRGDPPTNRVRLEQLSSLERRHLKEAFLAVREIQELTAMRFHTERLA
ncbi:MAG: cyclic nucleotide-binding/CBS domain-containing protein [Anaerolineales bacterium]|nr:cyclic nucleotide-binding/CBS domain-containing protein [Anaerolineales bacterium]